MTDDVIVLDNVPQHRSTCRYCCPQHDTLRAEIERLRAQRLAEHQQYDQWRVERDALRAERQEYPHNRLVAMQLEKDELRAEIERLRAQHDNDMHTIDAGSRANAGLEIENERLRHIHCECEYSEPCPNEAEAERLTQEVLNRIAEQNRLRAEIERLRAEREADLTKEAYRYNDLANQYERLRAALTEIMSMSEPAWYGEKSKAQIRDVTRRALGASET